MLPATPTSVSTYGLFQNLLVGPTDPNTMQDAAQWNQCASDASQLTNTPWRALVAFTAAASTGAIALQSHAALWGSSDAIKPVIAHAGTGSFTLTWPANVTDPLGNVVGVSFGVGPIAQVGGAACRHAQADRTTANTITVSTFLANGTADDLVGLTIKVFCP